MRKNKLLLLLVLLMTVATGAWADTTVTWTASDMSGLYIDFIDGIATNNTIKGITATGSTGGDGKWDGDDISAMNASNTITFTSSVGNIKSIAIKAESISLNPQGGWTLSDENKKLSWSGEASSTVSLTLSAWDGIDNISEIVFTIESAPATTYSITLAEGTEDGDNWTISPAEAAEGAKVTVTYSGEKKVKSVKAVKKAQAMTDLATITADYEAKDGETLTGTLASNVKISIADGATVTLKDVNITNLGTNCDWAGINCEGDATLVLEGTNTVCAGRDGDGNNNYPGIWIAPGKTLTIQGDGTLTAYSYASEPFGAGIGGGYGIACGNIVINSGTITATGGAFAAGIGSGQGADCGNITINGGTITATGGNFAAGIGSGNNSGSCGTITISGGTVEATGGNSGAGIGGGNKNGACGTITITSGVTSVKATKGTYAPNSIGKGEGGQDITVNIENGAKVIMTPVTVTWNSPNFNSSPYTRDGVTLTAGNAASGNNFYDFGEKTFTNTIGKFTKIEIVCGDFNLDGWAQEKVGEYSDPEGPSFEIFKLTWTGNAESVTIPAKYVYSIQSITFTIQ